MATYTNTYQPPKFKFPGMLGLFIIFIGLIILFAATYGHGVIKHGTDADLVHKCLDEKGPLQTWENLSTGKKVNVICAEVFNQDTGETEKRWGLQFINKVDREITAFIKDPSRYKVLSDIERYLGTSGFTPIP